MRLGVKCFVLALACGLSVHCLRADEVLTLDQLSDYTPDPTYDATQDPLHGFCYGTGCSNGMGFTISPGPQTGTFFVDLLIPNNDLFTVNFDITGTLGGANNNSSISGSPVLVSSTSWTSGTLSSYLGISASPTNPLSAWLPYTQAYGDAGATGYYVYSFDMGTNTLQPNGNWAAGPLLNIGPLPTGSLIVGFLDPPNTDVATANSGAILVSGSSSPVPEPASLATWLAGLVALAGIKLMRRPV